MKIKAAVLREVNKPSQDFEVAELEEEILKLELAFHEAFVNVVLHAYPNGDGDIVIRFQDEPGIFSLRNPRSRNTV
jgi:anti-sigma regulatory factor (Ser/Thr protein kinase)